MPTMVKKLLLDGFSPHRDASGFAIAEQIKRHYGESIEIHALQYQADANVLACPWVDYAHHTKQDSLDALLDIHQAFPYHALWLQHTKRCLTIAQHQSSLKQAGIRCIIPALDSIKKVVKLSQLNTIPQWPHITLQADDPYWMEKFSDLLPLCDWPLQMHHNKQVFFSKETLEQAIIERFNVHDSIVKIGPHIQEELLSAVALCDDHGNVVDVQIQRPLLLDGQNKFFLVNHPQLKALCLDIISQLNWKGALHFQFYQQEGEWLLFSLQTELPSWFTLHSTSDGMVPQMIRCLFDFERHAPIPQTIPQVGQQVDQVSTIKSKHYQYYKSFGSCANRRQRIKSAEESSCLLLASQHNNLSSDLQRYQGIATCLLNTSNKVSLSEQLFNHLEQHTPSAILGFDSASIRCLQSQEKKLRELGIWSLVPAQWSMDKAEALLQQGSSTIRINQHNHAYSLQEALSSACKLGYPLQLGNYLEGWHTILDSKHLEHAWHNLAFTPRKESLQLKASIEGDAFESVAFFDKSHQLYHYCCAKKHTEHQYSFISTQVLLPQIKALGKLSRWQGIIHCHWIRDQLTDEWILQGASPSLPRWFSAIDHSAFNWLEQLIKPDEKGLELPTKLIGSMITWHPKIQRDSVHTLAQTVLA